MNTIIPIIISYLIGSIPTSIWVGKFFYQKDIRQYGSGNAGATNTFRVLGKKAGVPVLLFDILKGFLSSYFVATIFEFNHSNELILAQILCGIASVIGHIFPIYENFKGGKGVATALGMVIGIHPPAAGICIIVFLIIFILSNYISLASMIASIVFPLAIILIFKNFNVYLITFSIFIPVLIIFTHKANIKRMIDGTENKMSFFKK